MESQPPAANTRGESSGTATGDLRQHELIDKLLPDPSKQQPLTILSGFLGRGIEPGQWRLYLTPSLSEYVELSEEAIVHTHTPTLQESDLVPTLVWVPSNAVLRHTRTTSRQIQADFLGGPITSRFRGRAGNFQSAMRLGMPGRAARTHDYVCSIDVDVCKTDFCSADVPRYCPTHFGCGLDTYLDCGWSDVVCG
jgi:hypothetical protein